MCVEKAGEKVEVCDRQRWSNVCMYVFVCVATAVHSQCITHLGPVGRPGFLPQQCTAEGTLGVTGSALFLSLFTQ